MKIKWWVLCYQVFFSPIDKRKFLRENVNYFPKTIIENDTKFRYVVEKYLNNPLVGSKQAYADVETQINNYVITIMGPNINRQYGDIIIIFKREITKDLNFFVLPCTSNLFVGNPRYGTSIGRLWVPEINLELESRFNLKKFEEFKLPWNEESIKLLTIDFILRASQFFKTPYNNITLDHIKKYWTEFKLGDLLESDHIIHSYVPAGIDIKMIDKIIYNESIREYMQKEAKNDK